MVVWSGRNLGEWVWFGDVARVPKKWGRSWKMGPARAPEDFKRVMRSDCHFTKITMAAVRRSPGGTQEWDKMDAMFIEYLLCERVLLSNGYSCEQDRPQSLPYCCPHPSVGRQAVKT